MPGQDLDERLRELRALVVVEIVGAQRQRPGLLGDGRGHARMAMTEHRHALGGAEVEVFPAVLVVHPATFATGDDDIAAPCRGAAENSFFDFRVVHFLQPGPQITQIRTQRGRR